ncbi:hypothetical protein ABZY06_16650 [Streptomyces sp. NPDC006540]
MRTPSFSSEHTATIGPPWPTLHHASAGLHEQLERRRHDQDPTVPSSRLS